MPRPGTHFDLYHVASVPNERSPLRAGLGRSTCTRREFFGREFLLVPGSRIDDPVVRFEVMHKEFRFSAQARRAAPGPAWVRVIVGSL